MVILLPSTAMDVGATASPSGIIVGKRAVAEIDPAACMAFYWIGVMCSKLGGGTSQCL